jgi:hypothetical protein
MHDYILVDVIIGTDLAHYVTVSCRVGDSVSCSTIVKFSRSFLWVIIEFVRALNGATDASKTMFLDAKTKGSHLPGAEC